jgi:cystathionine gamma-synthase
MNYKINTICVQGNSSRENVDNTGAVSFPIYQTAAYAHPGVGESTGYDYSRLQNPTRKEVERIVADLEGGIDALAFTTGMSAVHAMVELFQSGDHIVATSDLYGGTIRLFQGICEKNGISISYTDTSDVENIKKEIKENTKAIFLETPTNPMMMVTDIEEVCKLAKEAKLLVAVDNTFMTPYFQNPLKLGADIVLHSGTKYLGGHNDTLSGFLVTNRIDISEKLRYIIKTTGAGLAPFDSWLILRGLKTLALRMKQHQENALAIANWMTKQEKIKEVYYIGLDDFPGKEIVDKQSSGYSGMLSFRVDSEETARGILEKIQLIRFAESLGGVESLMTYPMIQTHADVPIEIREALGINNTLLRMSVGIEDAEDLIADLEQALKAV